MTHIGLPLLLAIAFVLLTGGLDGGNGVAPARLFEQPHYLLANALPGLLLTAVLLVMSRRLLWSFGVAFLLQGLLYGINTLKVNNLSTPLMPADFRMVGQLRKGGLQLLSGYLPSSPWPYLVLLGGIALVIVAWRYEPVLFARRTHGKRLLAGGTLAMALGSLLAGTPGWAHMYNGKQLWMEPWSAAGTAEHSGLVSSLLMFHLHYGHQRKKADPQAAIALLSQTDQALRQYMAISPEAASELPDIVVIQSESLFDPRILKGYEHSDFLPNVRRLAAAGSSGPLHVPTFGGGTIRTEFEVLTGLSLRYFDDLQFPYLQMNTKVVPGMVRTLRAHGYETTALHGNDPSFWNRHTAFKAIGFDHFISQSAFPRDAAKDGQYMSDHAMTNEILAQLKNAGPPQFLFAISIEAHGPYDTSPGIDSAERDAIPVPPGVVGKDKLELQNYLYHIGHADQELGRLADQLAKRERPTLLLFYGDHLPALAGVYSTAGFVDGKDMLSQAGTWLLVDPRNPRQPEHTDLASWMLPGKLLEHAGIHDDAYFALTQVLAPQLAGLTHAPGASPQTQDSPERHLDNAMANVALLRLKGRLDPLLPKAEPLPRESGIANHDPHPGAAAAAGVHQ
ncbi:LTA synthase family protein [Dyella tabacisoli]|uniref:LTA synthase family protein n=2 Tax=Dyella tabacisoli TaxID=2282381 RepID=A0A369UNB8_9GAMM|nr:LTA synthase family protein [Dyella tabacisoli]